MDRRLTLAAATLGSTIVFVDTTVVNVALPALREDLDAGLAAQQWVVEAYLLMLGSLVLIGGSLGDLLGRRRVFTLGVAGFGVTSVLAAVSPSVGVLIAARALQGLSGALLVPSSLAIITAVFHGEERGRAIGTWTAWTSASIAIGPLVGGLLIDATSWRAIFLINVPLVLVCLVLIARGVPELAGRPGRHVDVPGGALIALGLAGPVFALIHQPQAGWADPAVWGPMAAGIALLVAFVVHERRVSRDPMVPLGLFASRTFSIANAATLAIYAGLGAATFFIAIFLQQVAGYSATAAGAALIPITVIMVALSRRFGGLAERLGPRLFLGFGPLVAGAGLALYLLLGAEGDYLTGVLPGATVFGLGLAMTVAPLTTTVLSSADEEHAGVASGINNAVARVAGLLAIAAVGAIVASEFRSSISERGLEPSERRALVVPEQAPPPVAEALTEASVDAFHAGMLAAAGLVAAGGVLSLVGLPRRREAPATG